MPHPFPALDGSSPKTQQFPDRPAMGIDTNKRYTATIDGWLSTAVTSPFEGAPLTGDDAAVMSLATLAGNQYDRQGATVTANALTGVRPLAVVANTKTFASLSPDMRRTIEQVWPGGDPMAVRLGSTTFALRRREASAVMVEPVSDGSTP